MHDTSMVETVSLPVGYSVATTRRRLVCSDLARLVAQDYFHATTGWACSNLPDQRPIRNRHATRDLFN